MDWRLIPAELAAVLMGLMGVAVVIRPSVLDEIGVTSTSPLGRSELRAVFGGMFVAVALDCLVLQLPIVFAVAGSAWLADVAVRLVAVFRDKVPPKEAAAVLAIGTGMGLALLSGYWAA